MLLQRVLRILHSLHYSVGGEVWLAWESRELGDGQCLSGHVSFTLSGQPRCLLVRAWRPYLTLHSSFQPVRMDEPCNSPKKVEDEGGQGIYLPPLICILFF